VKRQRKQGVIATALHKIASIKWNRKKNPSSRTIPVITKWLRTHNTISSTAAKPHETDHAIRSLRYLIGRKTVLLRINLAIIA
jgi:hypothetical protein